MGISNDALNEDDYVGAKFEETSTHIKYAIKSNKGRTTLHFATLHFATLRVTIDLLATFRTGNDRCGDAVGA